MASGPTSEKMPHLRSGLGVVALLSCSMLGVVAVRHAGDGSVAKSGGNRLWQNSNTATSSKRRMLALI